MLQSTDLTLSRIEDGAKLKAEITHKRVHWAIASSISISISISIHIYAHIGICSYTSKFFRGGNGLYPMIVVLYYLNTSRERCGVYLCVQHLHFCIFIYSDTSAMDFPCNMI